MCVVYSFTAGLLVGVLLIQCVGVCGRKRKRGQTEISPVYEDITLEKTPAIQLQTNEVYAYYNYTKNSLSSNEWTSYHNCSTLNPHSYAIYCHVR